MHMQKTLNDSVGIKIKESTNEIGWEKVVMERGIGGNDMQIGPNIIGT